MPYYNTVASQKKARARGCDGHVKIMINGKKNDTGRTTDI